MNPDLLLSVLTAILGFVLKTTLAFGLCLLLSRLLDSPTRRFMIWSVFLYGAVGYWLWLVSQFVVGGRMAAGGSLAVALPVESAVDAWQLPDSWALPLGYALYVLGVGYLLVVSSLLFSHLKKQRHLQWVLRFTAAPPDEVAKIFRSLTERLHVRRSRLLVLPGATSPATFGWIRPSVLLPNSFLDQDAAALEDVLHHELQHIRRWDFFWNGLSLVGRAVVFFHPGVWYAIRRMQFDRELACDLAVVLHAPERRAAYAECLVRCARLDMLPEANAWGIDFAASSGHLKDRVHSILAGSRRSSVWSISLRAVFAVALLGGFVGIVPSLAVLASYSQPEVLKPLMTVVATAQGRGRIETRTMRKGRVLPPSISGVVASDGQAEASPDASPAASDGVDAKLSGLGPQLMHRGLGPDKVATQQSVALVDPSAAGATNKAGDRGQALQQTATAAVGIYKRLSGIDRH